MFQNAFVTEDVSKSLHRGDSGEALHTSVLCHHQVFYNPYTDKILSQSHQIMKISKKSRYWHYEEHIGLFNCTLRSFFLQDELVWIEAGMTSFFCCVSLHLNQQHHCGLK